MQALVQGEASSVTQPRIQLFFRSGEHMADIFSGAYVIEQLPTDYSDAPTEQVASRSIDTATEKLGTGRYVAVVPDTSAWDAGTYQLVVTYKLEDGGTDYTEVVPFELLDSNVFRPGTGFHWNGYAKTAHLLREGFAAAATPVGQIQLAVQRLSRQVEEWTLGRIFAPRYMALRLDGRGGRRSLMPNHALIAVEKIESQSYDVGGALTSYEYGSTSYRVYNRHMDGQLARDDRYNPRIELVNGSSEPPYIEAWSWPSGEQNIVLTGLFGYTDPDADLAAARVGAGQTPADIEYVVGVLLGRYLGDPTGSQDASVHQPGRIKRYKTRHQEIEYFGASAASYNSGMSGDPLLDQILQRYVAPISAEYIDERDPEWGV